MYIFFILFKPSRKSCTDVLAGQIFNVRFYRSTSTVNALKWEEEEEARIKKNWVILELILIVRIL